jgi:hypothetical protein
MRSLFPKNTAQECQPDGTLGLHYASMEDTYFCPDCRAEHTEPLEAVLGHIARCLGCAMLLEALTEDRWLYAQIREIRIAA